MTIFLFLVSNLLIQSHRQERKGHFRFKDLPAEIRNIIYSLLLVFPGPTYPSKAKPTEVTYHKHMTKARMNALPIPHSTLDLLLVDKEVCNEAAGLFYHHNDLVFSYPMQMQMFLLDLGPARFASVRQLSLFHDSKKLNGVSALDTALPQLRHLPHLRKFHLLVPNQVSIGPEGSCPSQIHGVQWLFTLRGLDDLKVRDLYLEDQVEGGEELNFFMGEEEKAVAATQTQVLKHFNHGLRIASEKSIVVRELFVKEWGGGGVENEKWPVLEGSGCGRKNGCSCGQKDGAF